MSGNEHLATGKQAELLACRYLQQQGLSLQQKNYSCKAGEIDLIMRERDLLVFVEVRFRKNSHFGNGAESITHHKRRKLITTARYYLQQLAGSPVACRFDVISISGPAQAPAIDWIKDAFCA